MPYLIAGFALLVGMLLAGRWFASAPPAQIARVLKWTLVIIFVPLTVFLVIRGGAEFLYFALPALLPWILRFRGAARMAKNWQRMRSGAKQASSGQTSSVETRFLRMELDHASGEMRGEVLQGRYTGRLLADLSLDELVRLLAECQDDEQSTQVLMSYLERHYPDEWRERAAAAGGEHPGGAAQGSATMSREEAYEILGLSPGASAEEIKEAHRQLMAKLHPDRGGTTYLASKINQAKDLLLGN